MNNPTGRRLALVLVGLVTAVGAAAALDSGSARIAPGRFLEHVRFLASDDLQGRGNGTPGLEKAADYIIKQFKEAGLEPGGENGAYTQPLEIVTGLQVGQGNALAFAGPGGATAFTLGEDYYPLSVAAGAPEGAASESLPLVFAGYGISAPAIGYDDYDGVEASGKAVLIFTHEPQEDDPSSRFEGKAHTQHATFLNKAMAARSRGASLLIVVEDPAHTETAGAPAGWLKDPQADDFGIPVVRIDRRRLAQVLGGAIDLEAAAREIDREFKPRSRLVSGMSLTFVERFTKLRRSVRNVVGILKGSDPARASEAIVIGAHYDHLGLGGRHSLAAAATGQIHNGADDNASGTAAILEVLREAASERREFPRTLVFVAFAGEELGLLGSAYYVKHPTVPLDRTVAMINLDMVGRPGGRILVSGLDTAPDLEADLKAAALAVTSLEIKTFRESAGVGSSDDTSFAVQRIPAIGFFSGFHADYHRPGDDWDKIDPEGGADVARLALALAKRIAARDERPHFVGAAPQAHGGTAAAGTGGYGAYFGSVPDFSESEEAGVKFADVREGSPAAKAGLRRGDVLISFAGTPIKTLYDFTFALRSRRPGDAVDVVVWRDGQQVKATVELANRP